MGAVEYTRMLFLAVVIICPIFCANMSIIRTAIVFNQCVLFSEVLINDMFSFRTETGEVRRLSVPDKETGEADVWSKVPTGYAQ